MLRCVSIMPGITMPSDASISVVPSGTSRFGPTAAILSSWTSTSAPWSTSCASFMVSTVPPRSTIGSLISPPSLAGGNPDCTFPSGPVRRQGSRIAHAIAGTCSEPRPVMSHVDLHLHLLPGVDDGPPDMDASLAHAARLARDGVHEATATPHVGPPALPALVAPTPARQR